MGLASGAVWMVLGLALAVITMAVTPTEQALPKGLTCVFGTAGGLLGGSVITLLANKTLTGFATGIVGGFMGSIAFLLAWGVLAHPVHRGT
jgi:uncharacterized membrane protein YeaQ/YmgE (transglycosylase-associated protein family)